MPKNEDDVHVLLDGKIAELLAKIATVDIPGAFLQNKIPKNEDDVHVLLDGKIAELLAKIATVDIPGAFLQQN